MPTSSSRWNRSRPAGSTDAAVLLLVRRCARDRCGVRATAHCSTAGTSWPPPASCAGTFRSLAPVVVPVELRYPDRFHPGEQGVLNYVLDGAERRGRRPWTGAASRSWPRRSWRESGWRRSAAGSPGFVVHYNGRKPDLLIRFPRRELLGFFERVYYSRVIALIEPLRQALPAREPDRRMTRSGLRGWLEMSREYWPEYARHSRRRHACRSERIARLFRSRATEKRRTGGDDGPHP
jgi:hypothetical protein